MADRNGVGAYEELLSRLNNVKRKGTRQSVACCPAHDDKTPSLQVGMTDEGKVLLHCFAGCPPLSIVHALGMSLGDLFPDGLEDNRPPGWAMAEFREKRKAEAHQWKEETILKLTQKKRERGEKLSRQELDRELEAYEYTRDSNG